MKKIISLIIAFTFIIACLTLSSCGKKAAGDEGKLKITTTVFPPYDFARQIAGENAEIKMLVPPGSESHSFEPSLTDLSVIYNSDIFIYAGGDSEEWVKDIAENAAEKGVLTLAMTDCTELIYKKGHEHDSDHSHTVQEIDEHVWTTPNNAILICEKIKELMCQKDEKNTEIYNANYDRYKAELEALHNEFTGVIQDATTKTLVFEGRCPFAYFCKEYGLVCHSAIDGCSSNTEVGLTTVSELIGIVKEQNIPAVLYIELSNQEIADTICKSTGAKKLFLHSCHCISKEEIESGATYISLMKNNVETVREALG
ncbi:MAG: zinc ABC transporter substrate-binding protein [Clostridia bacterium]|nr:zinc ABC transporter substrate-binding protein [Clostridia bacterium]